MNLQNPLTFKDNNARAKWDAGLAKNSDPYGRGVYTFASRWATLMEKQLAAGKKVQEIAQAASSEADTEGITGFMYGCAVGILSEVWVHGEALRRWHNKDVQLGDEGDKANEKPGAVLNPALLSIK